MTKKIIIVGGGTAGISVASRLKNSSLPMEITIIDPSDKHFYQPMWTLVGAGVFSHEQSEREMSSLIPAGVNWLKKSVSSFIPDENKVVLNDDSSLSYDVLIVCPGLQLDWHKIKGAKEALSFENVCSNYLPFGSSKTWDVMNRTRQGNAIFTQPPFPIKCGGAPQKAAYLADDFFRKNLRRSDINLVFACSAPRIFGVDKYRVVLEELIKKKEISTMFEHNLTEIRPEENVAVFTKASGEKVEVSYSMLHVVPPMSAPDFVKHSQLANQEGWVEVDKYKLQHIKYKNVFSLGDASSLPTSKTGAAIRKQVPVLVANVISYLNNDEMTKKYDGYTSCPLVTGYGKVIMAEFDYEGNPAETFPFDQSKERFSMWLLKAYLLPILYWQGMLKGRA